MVVHSGEIGKCLVCLDLNDVSEVRSCGGTTASIVGISASGEITKVSD